MLSQRRLAVTIEKNPNVFPLLQLQLEIHFISAHIFWKTFLLHSVYES